MKPKQYISIIIIILVLIAGYWLLTRGKKASAPSDTNTPQNQTNPENSSTTPGTATNQLTSDDAVAISNQGVGSSITIDNYVLSKPGFIAIYEKGADGKAGKLVGQSGLLKAGKGQDLEVNAAIANGKSYIAELYFDNGDKKFSASSDQLVVSGGNTVMTNFMIGN